MEAAARLDRRSDDDELGAVVGRDPRGVLAEAAGARPDDPPPHADSVGLRDRGRSVEPPPQLGELTVELRVQRQLAGDDERRHEHDARAAVGGEPAGEVERVLRLLSVEERHDDAAVRDRAGPAGEPPRPVAEEADVETDPHRSSW